VGASSLEFAAPLTQRRPEFPNLPGAVQNPSIQIFLLRRCAAPGLYLLALYCFGLVTFRFPAAAMSESTASTER
jgi:hypothetical protein